ncbi:MAG: type I-E CRISPR-associated protein Cas6/Cse3/CasE [Gemmatimonas sp.]
MSDHYFTVATVQERPSADVLRALADSVGKSERAVASHHIVWKLFGDTAERRRDFLWREHTPGQFYLLSDRPPADNIGLFELQAPKVYAPNVEAGDTFDFEVRVNATIARKKPGEKRGKRADVVMNALHDSMQHSTHDDDRAAVRSSLIDRVAGEWLERQGVTHGFTVRGVSVQGYSVVRLDRGRRNERASLGVLDLKGSLQVDAAEEFLSMLVGGLGRGRAFGCGLMMIRRG